MNVASKATEPLDVPYSDAEDYDKNLDIETGSQPLVVTEKVVLEAPSLPVGSSGGSSSSCSTEESSGQAAKSPHTKELRAENNNGEDEEKDDSSVYFIAEGDPSEAAIRLCFPLSTRVVGDQHSDALNFYSGGHERRFLAEARESFCLPFMEEKFCKAETKNILNNDEDLALKTFVAARCVSRSYKKHIDK